jgi:hypothetical protein
LAANHPILVQVLGTAKKKSNFYEKSKENRKIKKKKVFFLFNLEPHQQCFVEFCVELMLSLGFVTILHHLKT